MAPVQNGAYFSVETFVVDDNRKIGKAVRDKDGYFIGVPVAVLGTVTRNLTQYDTADFLKQIKGPDTSFHKRLTEGCLFGEWGHPFVDLNSQAGMARLLNLDPQKESHHIRSVAIKHLDDLNLDLVIMDAKGTGPYGRYYDEAMLDPTRNLAHSLRGISEAAFNRSTNVTNKKLRALVTFDAGVASGGFKEASKRYMESVENLAYGSFEVMTSPITSDNLSMVRSVALETFQETELNEIMKAHKVVIGTVTTGFVDKDTATVIQADTNERRSLFHSFMRVKR